MNFEDYETLPTQNPITHMTAGAVAGVMEHCVMYPLDSVKTRMQSLRAHTSSSISETLRLMVRREGLLRPVRGMSAVVAGAGPAHACFFATYEQSKAALTGLARRALPHTRAYDHLAHGLSGCLASLVHDAVSNPAEVVKQRLQMVGSPYRGAWECARRVYRTEGMRAFYRSYGTQVALSVPFHALHFATYEWAQSRLNPTRAYSPAAHALSGALAGALAAAATTPLDVCKTLLNTQEHAAVGLGGAASRVLASGGWRGFLRGVRPRVLYQMPAAAICWLTYESMKHLLAHETLSDESGVASTPPSSSSGGPPLVGAALRIAAADSTLTRS